MKLVKRELSVSQKAHEFADCLDRGKYHDLWRMMDRDCTYSKGDDLMYGAMSICNAYEANIRQMQNELEEFRWDNSRVSEMENNTFLIHLSDHLKQNGRTYVHKSTLRIMFNEPGLIYAIEHIDEPEEMRDLEKFLQETGML